MLDAVVPGKYLLFIFFTGIVASCEIDPDLVDPLNTDLFVTYDASNGMGGNQVRDIYLDSRNHLWFACYNHGITRYDGDSFIHYNRQNSGLGNDRVLCITEDGDGDMWFGTTTRLYFLVDQSEWYYYDLIDSVDVQINTLYTDSEDLVWIGTGGEGLFFYDQGTIYGPYKFSDPAEMNIINDINHDNSGSLWIATDYAASRFNGEYWEIYPGNQEYPEIKALHLDSRGKLWTGSSGGYSINYYYESSFTSLNPFNGKVNIFINDITSDLTGNIWFATILDGIIQYDGVEMHSYKPNNGFPSEDNFCIETDHYGNIWIGTYEKGAVKYIPPVRF